MNAEDLMLVGLAGAVVFLFMRQQPQAAVQVGPMTPQGSSYPAGIFIPMSTSQSTPASYMGGTFYIDANGQRVNCPPGQYVTGCGIAGTPCCLAPGQFVG